MPLYSFLKAVLVGAEYGSAEVIGTLSYLEGGLGGRRKKGASLEEGKKPPQHGSRRKWGED